MARGTDALKQGPHCARHCLQLSIRFSSHPTVQRVSSLCSVLCTLLIVADDADTPQCNVTVLTPVLHRSVTVSPWAACEAVGIVLSCEERQPSPGTASSGEFNQYFMTCKMCFLFLCLFDSFVFYIGLVFFMSFNIVVNGADQMCIKFDTHKKQA